MLFPCCGARCISLGKEFMRECLEMRLCCYPANTAGTSGVELCLYSQAIVFFGTVEV